jgi:hypothetical protein
MAIVGTFGDGDMLEIIRRLPFHEVVQSGISALEGLVQGNPSPKCAMGQHQFIYLISAIAKEMKGWLPDDFYLKLIELCSYVSMMNQELPAQLLHAAAEYLLAGK